MVWPNLTYSHLLADSVYIHSSVKIIMKKKKNNKKKNRKQVWYKYDLTWKFVNRYIYIYILYELIAFIRETALSISETCQPSGKKSFLSGWCAQ